MKKILMVAAILVSVLLVSGCGKNETRTAVTAAKFYNKVGESYKLTDITSKMGYVKKAYAFKNDDIYFYFYEGNRSFDMGNIYLDELENAASTMTNQEEEISKGENFSSIILKDENNYCRIAYVENTLLYAKTNAANKDKADEIFEMIGY